MGSDAVLRSSLVFLAALVVLVGFCTFSLKKMFATYVFGLLAIAGVVLPDWEFFDRDFKEWFSPLPSDKRNRNSVGNSTAIRRTLSLNVVGWVTAKDYEGVKSVRWVAVLGSPVFLVVKYKAFQLRFKLYPGRLVLYTTIYSFGLYKWWTFITN